MSNIPVKENDILSEVHLRSLVLFFSIEKYKSYLAKIVEALYSKDSEGLQTIKCYMIHKHI